MRRSQRLDEMEFELALVGVLEEMYGINVRVRGDPLNRRRDGYATLEFDYFADDVASDDPNSSGEVKVVVSIQGLPGASFSFSTDLHDPESVLRAADDCENVAFALREYTGENAREQMRLTRECDAAPQRRWDD